MYSEAKNSSMDVTKKRKPTDQELKCSSGDTVISIQDLGKCYQIYDKPNDRLKQSIYPRIQRLVGITPKEYHRRFWALQGVSFDVKHGETIGIIGRNGSGKSTLLQIICGTLAPTIGSVATKGRIAALLELGSGFNPEFTGRENVYLNGSILGLTRDEIDSRLDDIFAFADIGDFVDQPVKNYSSGMFVRLAFATQAHVDPDILVVDEALAVGDSYFVHKCMLRFHYLRERGTTILLVTHDATAVKTLCNRAVWIDQGGVASIGDSSIVVDQYLSAVRKLPVYQDYDTGSSITKNYTTNNDQCPNALEEREIPNIDRRLGTQECTFIGIGLYDEHMNKKTALSNDSTVILRVTFKNQTLEENRLLVLGYSLRNNRGVDIASNNSEIEKTEIITPPPGEKKTIRIYIDLPELHPGSYSFSVSVGYRKPDGSMQSLDGITNSIAFDIVSERIVHVLMSLRSKFKEEAPLEISY
jgi:lipopolysaccharide transport system ATP-binding protein